MTPLLQKIRERAAFDFGTWWFINGGQLHGIWKRKQYSSIFQFANTLPQCAYKRRDDELMPLIEALIRAVEHSEEVIHGEFCGSDACHPLHKKMNAILEKAVRG